MPRTPIKMVKPQMSLFVLPGELLLGVAEQLEQERDINALSRTNKQLHRLIDDYLYRRNARQSHGSALLWTAENGGTRVTQRLLDYGADVNVQNYKQKTPLLLAAEAGQTDIVRLLLAVDGILADIERSKGTPLKLAAQHGHEEIVRLLLATGKVDPNAGDEAESWGRPLWWAAKGGYEEIVNLLLQEEAILPDATGFDENSEDESVSTPLAVAAVEGHAGVVKSLLECKSVDPDSRDENNNTPLLLASYAANAEIVKLLLETGAVAVNVVDDDGFGSLYFAARHGSLEILKMLLDKGADVHATGSSSWTALHGASSSGHVDIVRTLLQNGAQAAGPTDQGWTPLHLASFEGHLAVAELLLESGAPLEELNEDSNTPLQLAVCKDRRSIVQLLLRHGALINTAAAREVWTPLSHAAEHGFVEVMQMLLDAHAQTDIRDSDSNLPIHNASGNGHTAATQLLLDRRAGIDAEDSDGWTALYLACAKGHLNAMQILLERRARIRSPREYHSFLQAAAWNGSLHTIQVLEERRDSVPGHIDPREALEALHLACMTGHADTVEHFLSNGVDPWEEDEHGWHAFLCISQNQGSENVRRVLETFDPYRSIWSTPLSPTCFSDIDNLSRITLSENNSVVTYTGSGGVEGARETASVLANHPVPFGAREFYFEITILNAGEDGSIGIGLCRKYTPLDILPGWNKGSWGYHADDGKIYLETGEDGHNYGPKAEARTVMGCRYDFGRGTIEFSNGGGFFGIATTDVYGKLYPFVGLGSPGASVKVNFGQEPFYTRKLVSTLRARRQQKDTQPAAV